MFGEGVKECLYVVLRSNNDISDSKELWVSLYNHKELTDEQLGAKVREINNQLEAEKHEV